VFAAHFDARDPRETGRLRGSPEQLGRRSQPKSSTSECRPQSPLKADSRRELSTRSGRAGQPVRAVSGASLVRTFGARTSAALSPAIHQMVAGGATSDLF